MALVTGGSNGIGRSIVECLHEHGATVVFIDIDVPHGRELLETLDQELVPAQFRECDVTSEIQIKNTVDSIMTEFGGLHVLVNNAGRNAYLDARTATESDWDSLMALDLKAAWLCAKHAIPAITATTTRGAVVNIASIHSLATVKGMFPYAVAKAGLLGLTRSLALDFGRDGVRVNAVCPGWVLTEPVKTWLASQDESEAFEKDVLSRHPLGRIGTPREIANVVAFLCSDHASYVTGAVFLADGGLTAQTV